MQHREILIKKNVTFDLNFKSEMSTLEKTLGVALKQQTL